MLDVERQAEVLPIVAISHSGVIAPARHVIASAEPGHGRGRHLCLFATSVVMENPFTILLPVEVRQKTLGLARRENLPCLFVQSVQLPFQLRQLLVFHPTGRIQNNALLVR